MHARADLQTHMSLYCHGLTKQVPEPMLHNLFCGEGALEQRTTCLPSSHAVLLVHRKNCEPLVFAPALAMDRMPAQAAAGSAQCWPDTVPARDAKATSTASAVRCTV